MKRLICFALCLVWLGTVPLYANSAPSYWSAYPYSDVLAVEKDSPIRVDREQLTFDFSKPYDDEYFPSPVGRVTAEYQMTNPTEKTLAVQMAFPFVSSLADLSVKEISISADGAAVPYEIFVDPKEVNASGMSEQDFSYNYGSIGDISSREWTIPGFSLYSEAKLYRFLVSGREDRNLNLEISFDADPEQSLLIGKDFGGAAYSDETGGTLSARIREESETEILVLGTDVEFAYKITDGDKIADQSSYQFEVLEESVDPKKYLLGAFSREIGAETAGAISDVQLLNLLLDRIWQESRGSGFTTLFDGISTMYNDRVFTLVYEVEFPANVTKDVTAAYLTGGSMDRRETVSPKYSYTYLLSPAENWADFNRLDIEIITPPSAPYIVESSHPLEREGENRYKAGFDGLPEGELFFTLYEKERIPYLDKVEKSVRDASYIIYFLWPLLLIILAVVMIPVVRAILRKNR